MDRGAGGRRGSGDHSGTSRGGDDGHRSGVEALDDALARMLVRFTPTFLIYLAGADPHEGDRLGRLALSFDGLAARDRRVFDWCWQRGLPVAFCMAGGYGRRLEDTVQAQCNTFAVALAYWTRWAGRWA